MVKIKWTNKFSNETGYVASVSAKNKCFVNTFDKNEAKEYSEKNYVLFSDMMEDIDVLLQGKIFSYFPISQSELNEAISRTTKPLYLFKITNKDLSFAETYEKGLRKSRGTDNLHTMYFKALMSGNQDVFDIGSGSIYFREHKIIYQEEFLRSYV